MQEVAFYGPVFWTAWNITAGWVVAWAVFPGAVVAVISAAASVFLFEFVISREKVSAVTWRVLRIFVEAVVGLAATVGVMFLLSLCYYAPPIVVRQIAGSAHNEGARQTSQTDADNFRQKVVDCLGAKNERLTNVRDELKGRLDGAVQNIQDAPEQERKCREHLKQVQEMIENIKKSPDAKWGGVDSPQAVEQECDQYHRQPQGTVDTIRSDIENIFQEIRACEMK